MPQPLCVVVGAWERVDGFIAHALAGCWALQRCPTGRAVAMLTGQDQPHGRGRTGLATVQVTQGKLALARPPGVGVGDGRWGGTPTGGFMPGRTRRTWVVRLVGRSCYRLTAPDVAQPGRAALSSCSCRRGSRGWAEASNKAYQ